MTAFDMLQISVNNANFQMSVNLSELLNQFHQEGILLWVDSEGRLRYRAPKGIVTEAHLRQLREYRSEFIELIERQTECNKFQLDSASLNEPFRLTNIQTAYLLGRRDVFDYGGVGCHGYLEYCEREPFDCARLEMAWSILIDRHPMLRATFAHDGTQQVLKSVPAFKIELTKVKEGFEQTVEERRQSMSHLVYEGSTWPMFSVALTQGVDKSVMHISFDLLVADFVSFELILNELGVLYDNPDACLPPVELTFRDYILFTTQNERSSEEKSRYERDKEWWLKRVSQFPSKPELPLLQHEKTKEPRFERCKVLVAAEDLQKLHERAGENSITLSSVIFAAYCEVIAKWSRTDQFAIALPLLDRQQIHTDINSVVGDFTGLSLFAVNHDSTSSFTERAKQCQSQLWDDLDHRAYSGVDFARDIAQHTNQSNILFPVVFTSTVGTQNEKNRNASSVRWAFTKASYGITQTPQVWLDCQVIEDEDRLLINFDYRTGIFLPGIVEDMASAFESLLSDLACSEQFWLSNDPIQLLEKQQILRETVNNTLVSRTGRLIHESTFLRCAEHQGKLAIVAGDERLTFGELQIRACEFASQLLGKFDLEPKEVVAVVLPKGINQVLAVFGVLLAGATYLPIDAYQPVARRSKILEDGGVRVIITDSLNVEQEWAASRQILDVAKMNCMTFCKPEGSDQQCFPKAKLTDLAYTIYTGGSTGLPKGVMVSHQAAENTIDDICCMLDIDENDSMLGLSHLGFDLSVFDIFGILGAGATLVIPNPDRLCDPSHWLELLQIHGVTLWNSVPAQMQMLIDYIDGNKNIDISILKLRYILLSGDWIPVDLPDRIWSVMPNVKLLSLGGATEAAIWSIYHHIESVDLNKPSIPYGRPLRNQSFHVLDKGLRPRPNWVTGDLYISGIGLAEGYMADEEKTALSFINHPHNGQRLYRTGDCGRYNDLGEIELLGREDLQVKVRGHRIELREIEMAAVSLSFVNAAVAIVVGNNLSRYLALAVEPASEISDESQYIDQIQSGIEELLPHYMVPSSFMVMANLPLTDSNKVDRVTIANILTDRSVKQSLQTDNFEAPKNELEVAVAELIAQTLGLSSLGRHDDFMSLGGNSLLAARIVSDVRLKFSQGSIFGFDEMLVALLDHRTVAGFVEFLEVESAVRAVAKPLVGVTTMGSSENLAIISLSVSASEDLKYAQLLDQFHDDAFGIMLNVENFEILNELQLEIVLDRFVDACFDNIEKVLNHQKIIVLGSGDRTVAAVELARRLREVGAEVISVFSLPCDEGGRSLEILRHWHKAINQFVVYPYLGDVVLIEKDDSGIDWDEVALGNIFRVNESRTTETLLREKVDSVKELL